MKATTRTNQRLFGSEKIHEVWRELGPERAWLYLGITVELHIFDGENKIGELYVLSDDKTVVPNIPMEEIPEDVKQALKKHGYVLKKYDDLTPEQRAELEG